MPDAGPVSGLIRLLPHQNAVWARQTLLFAARVVGLEHRGSIDDLLDRAIRLQVEDGSLDDEDGIHGLRVVGVYDESVDGTRWLIDVGARSVVDLVLLVVPAT